MPDASTLVNQIKDAFGIVPFPLHCGLHAALKMSDWVTDKSELMTITHSKDYLGDWWNVPESHLHKCMIALSYLDSAAMEFYLPAYMKAVIENPITFDKPRVRSSSWQVISTMEPDKDNPELLEYFYERFARIQGKKWKACREFLQYVSSNPCYDEHARTIAKEALCHAFWTENN